MWAASNCKLLLILHAGLAGGAAVAATVTATGAIVVAGAMVTVVAISSGRQKLIVYSFLSTLFGAMRRAII